MLCRWKIITTRKYLIKLKDSSPKLLTGNVLRGGKKAPFAPNSTLHFEIFFFLQLLQDFPEASNIFLRH